MLRTFLDTGVLIAAARSIDPDRERALQLLGDPSRTFLTSPYIYLEVVPKTIFYKRRSERSFYQRYFDNAVWFRNLGRIEEVARAEAAKSGLGAMDALHIAAASLADADEFVTTERPGKAIHRSSLLPVVYLFR